MSDIRIRYQNDSEISMSHNIRFCKSINMVFCSANIQTSFLTMFQIFKSANISERSYTVVISIYVLESNRETGLNWIPDLLIKRLKSRCFVVIQTDRT